MIVSNTTPLINFCAIKRLDILQNLFKHISIPSILNLSKKEIYFLP